MCRSLAITSSKCLRLTSEQGLVKIRLGSAHPLNEELARTARRTEHIERLCCAGQAVQAPDDARLAPVDDRQAPTAARRGVSNAHGKCDREAPLSCVANVGHHCLPPQLARWLLASRELGQRHRPNVPLRSLRGGDIDNEATKHHPLEAHRQQQHAVAGMGRNHMPELLVFVLRAHPIAEGDARLTGAPIGKIQPYQPRQSTRYTQKFGAAFQHRQ
mmetsp:Transcript_2973/g.8965  ORF Transcript_2973/g.8965 Transcript_2973/m.8965 type:complete len:216 (-) Transcript_2973:693-1340(-)